MNEQADPVWVAAQVREGVREMRELVTRALHEDADLSTAALALAQRRDGESMVGHQIRVAGMTAAGATLISVLLQAVTGDVSDRAFRTWALGLEERWADNDRDDSP